MQHQTFVTRDDGFRVIFSRPRSLNDVFKYTLGASYRLDAPTSAPQRELTAFWSRRLDTGWRAQLYVLVGLADGSPDFGAGVSVAYAF